jgi:hypothetical protein
MSIGREPIASPPEPCKKGAEHLNGGPHLRYQFVGSFLAKLAGRIDDKPPVLALDGYAEPAKHVRHELDIGDLRDALEHDHVGDH